MSKFLLELRNARLMLTYVHVVLQHLQALDTLTSRASRVLHFASTSIRYIPLNRAGTRGAVLSP